MRDITAGNAGKVRACIDRFDDTKYAMKHYAAGLKAKFWPQNSVLDVSFLDGSQDVQDKVAIFAKTWEEFCNIRFNFENTNPWTSQIRVSFAGEGSWSSIGTDALDVKASEPTMNFGWLDDDSTDEEYRRVVLHEFGHALGMIHEHQNPSGGIDWNRPAVYRYYEGPPNNWNRGQIDANVFEAYKGNVTQFTTLDPTSIMMYPIDGAFTNNNFAVGLNTSLSEADKQFIGGIYPIAGKAKNQSAASGGAIDSTDDSSKLATR